EAASLFADVIISQTGLRPPRTFLVFSHSPEIESPGSGGAVGAPRGSCAGPFSRLPGLFQSGAVVHAMAYSLHLCGSSETGESRMRNGTSIPLLRRVLRMATVPV